MEQLFSFKKKVIDSHIPDFWRHAFDLFEFQFENNPIYNKYVKSLGVEISNISSLEEIPFMPISFFKRHKVKTYDWEEAYVFKSSGTTGDVRSKHYIDDLEFYKSHAYNLFVREFGDVSDDAILGLLPSYNQQGNSSLIQMVDHLMKKAHNSGYFLDDFASLQRNIKNGLKTGNRVILFGVGYALLDFANSVEDTLDGLIIIETGGMKGRREEMTKAEFYDILKDKLGQISVVSEYGMTELLSQAYSHEGSILKCPKTMQILIRDLQDPFSNVSYNKTGGINVIDLANVHSCAFIETQDIGRNYKNGYFEVLGRMDNSDVRGCNLLVH